MASRIMHLAIANEIAKEIEIEDMSRFRLGSILPDAYAKGTLFQKEMYRDFIMIMG